LILKTKNKGFLKGKIKPDKEFQEVVGNYLKKGDLAQ